MGNFEIGDYVVAVIVFMMLVLGGISIYGNVFTADYFVNTEYENFSNTFNKSVELTNNIEALKGNVSGATPGDDSGLLGSINSLIKTAFSGVKIILSTFTIMDLAFGGITSIFGFPLWLSILIKTLITALIVFAIYKLIFRSPTV
jgi:hypothetical protein